MADDDVWIFISYAHDDDLPTGDSEDEEGFVTYLHRMLETKLRDLGVTRAKLWRDHKRFGNGEPYDLEIEDALKKSPLLIVVMSRNWMSRPYCRKELNDFIRMRHGDGVADIAQRMTVVGKHFLARENRPSPLDRQMGFEFYQLDHQDEVSPEKEFFNLGKAADGRFFQVRDELARHLQNQVDRIAATDNAPAPPVKIAADNGRTVYLSKPAADMEQAYSRLALELQGRGYSVVPDVSSGIPSTGAREYIDAALNRAELSIHLVGEKRGFVPDDDDTPEPIVKLQLVRATERATAAKLNREGSGFRRVVWAPRVVEASEPQGVGAVAGRDPIQVLARFDQQCPSDIIVGDVINKFIESLLQHLTETAGRPIPTPGPGGQFQVYLDYDPRDDEKLALAIAEALNNQPVSIVLPASGEPAPEARTFNRDLLAKSDGVVLFWGAASEVWVRSEAARLYDWQGLGRTEQFSRCSLIVGPPPAPRKSALNLLFKKGQFDKVVDIADKGMPTGNVLIDLAPGAKAPLQ
ncbi:MAG: toll/interleukin-1 receptor domain-containing protein [Deltaproteobacteria bacterium]|nr:toll/interleukin-1 receptor domain-containing protein [Deltaproteobacteria bacterium]